MYMRLSICFALLCLGSLARAGVVFNIETFDATGTVAKSSFMQGETVTVRMIGIDSAGSGPDFTVDTLSSFNATLVASNTDADGAAFSFPNFDFPTPPTGTLSSGRFFGAGNFTATIEPSGLTLAQFQYSASTLGTTTFSFDTSLPSNNIISFFTGGNALSPASYNTSNSLAVNGGSISVTAVPEPASFAVLGIIGSGVIGYRRRRGRKALAC